MPVHFTGIDNASNKLRKIKELVENGMSASLDVALDLEERHEGSESVKELQDVMVQYVHMDREMDQWIEAVDHAKAQFTKQYDPASDVPDIEAIFQEKLDALESENNDKDLLKHKRVKEFEKKLWKVHHEGVSMPEEGGAAAKDNEDDDLMIAQATVQTKCPITTKDMTKPMMHKKCKHNYDKDAIEFMIKKAGRKQVKCPISGCPQFVTSKDLEPNVELEHHIARKNRKK